MQELQDLLTNDNSDVQMDAAALDIASIENPGLEREIVLRRLDQLAFEIADRVSDLSDGREFVNGANRYLFNELGFRGNQIDYYNPWNSCIDQVLETKLGIPITLSVVYIEIGRRLAKSVSGIGLPGHFIVRYDDEDYSTFIDPFRQGVLLDADDCMSIVVENTGFRPTPTMFQPATHRQIAVRMLQNLKSIYLKAGSWEKAVTTLDLILEADPAAAQEYKQRGWANLQLQRFQPAQTDLQDYLKLNPEAEDAELIKEHLESVYRYLSGLH